MSKICNLVSNSDLQYFKNKNGRCNHISNELSHESKIKLSKNIGQILVKINEQILIVTKH